ncbi:hypothetical protein D3C86_1618630 [compost metagenome]
MQFFIHKPPRKPGIDGGKCVIKTWQGFLVECEYKKVDDSFHALDCLATYSCRKDTVSWWCYSDSLISHLESEEK